MKYISIMKSVIIICAIVGVVLTTAGVTQAATMYYTFEGEIEAIYDEAGIVASTTDLVVGSPVSHTFAVDFEQDGFSTRFDDIINTYTDGWDMWLYGYRDYFYADLISPVLVDFIEGGYHSQWPHGVSGFNYGLYGDRDNESRYEFYLFGGGSDNLVEIDYVSTERFEPADILVEGGSGFYLYDFGYNASGQSSFFRANMTLTDISDDEVVVEDVLYDNGDQIIDGGNIIVHTGKK